MVDDDSGYGLLLLVIVWAVYILGLKLKGRNDICGIYYLLFPSLSKVFFSWCNYRQILITIYPESDTQYYQSFTEGLSPGID